MVPVREHDSSVVSNYERALALYDTALRDSFWRPEIVCARSGWTDTDLAAAINYLASLGLLVSTDSTPSGWLALPPETALSSTVRSIRKHITDLRSEMERSEKAVKQILSDFRAVHLRRQSMHDMEVIVNGPEISAALENAVHAARSEVVVLCGNDIVSSSLYRSFILALQRNVPVSIAYLSPQVKSSRIPPPFRAVISAGAEFRTVETVPFELLIADRSVAYFPAPWDYRACRFCDPGDLVVVKNKLTAEILHSIFISCWSEASALVPGSLSPAAAGERRHRINRSDRVLLHLLAAGLTDKSIGRKLGVTERTIRRRVASLMSSLNAESRFQLGMNAVRVGWLAEDG